MAPRRKLQRGEEIPKDAGLKDVYTAAIRDGYAIVGPSG